MCNTIVEGCKPSSNLMISVGVVLRQSRTPSLEITSTSLRLIQAERALVVIVQMQLQQATSIILERLLVLRDRAITAMILVRGTLSLSTPIVEMRVDVALPLLIR